MVEDKCRGLEDLVLVDRDARRLGVHVAYTTSFLEESPREDMVRRILDREVERLVDFIKEKYALDSLRADPIVRGYRDFYWRIGIDPTKTRPSSEALVRRILRGRFPRINPVVDAGNIASARTMVPIGLYDSRYYKPPLVIRLSKRGEVFEPIGGSREELGEGIPVLVDTENTILHLYPHRDSKKTMIREDTREVLILAAGVPRVPSSLVIEAVRETARILGEIGWRTCEPIVYKG